MSSPRSDRSIAVIAAAGLLLCLGLAACQRPGAVAPPEPATATGSGAGSAEAGDRAGPTSSYALGEGDLPSQGANADVLHVRAIQEGETSWRFEVTIQHPMRSAKDRTDGWDLILPDGGVLLPDPQAAFTMPIDAAATNEAVTHVRGGIELPLDVREVVVRAHDAVDGFGGREVTVFMWAGQGAGFEVIHTY